MSVILQNCCPPLVEAAKLGGLCSQVYALLFESAYKDVRRDPALQRTGKIGATVVEQLSGQLKALPMSWAPVVNVSVKH